MSRKHLDWAWGMAAALTLATVGAIPLAQAQDNGGFDAAVRQSDAKMSRAMKSAPVNGNPDHDFLVKMMPHHQGAIAMARTELKYGKDPKIKQMARKMIIDQQKDLAKMRQQLRRMRG